MRILCLDIGNSRVGVAISDPLKITAQPVMTIELRNKDLFEELDKIFQGYNIEKVVIGYPLSKLHPDQKDEKLKKIDEISEKIGSRYNVEIVKWDERFSTKAVERVIDEELNWKRKKKIIDKVAAVYILQGYLDFYNGS
ncbi:putative Holliday junction resolvase [Caldicellulosiruptor bescii]|uniref:Putative pre-16S rRNA nuclease n=2 Tax=Caldicellulosiruptor bescii TaxID=31899 RepID=YQGF_CALBD|nr:Holliday junction resolvase RuvX [Caldicellulosiruptor bescii]B9MRK7.1 RecName: Full=Putative pre-16S rRNA nuclease [Caldicellulosiruptor bescii DSM 6725]ACM60311.1 Holliday junction resolvase YqgF [Caldicellulosiruptor bescii DSM 6725]PBC87725.1 putative Holliday junction resolvase [Caldicellulosiruptor bescii]PBC90658.1 putative Holliday junction resolvase [Caldicellulosiruptor bescii]PBD03910.1 putative Holliday junction resolvase [Caldicellulosiruptor bescii]PBD06455.1 putative Hollida